MLKNKYEIENNYVSIEVKNSKNTYQCLVDTKDFHDKIINLNKLFVYETYKGKKPYIYFNIGIKKIKLHRYLTNCPDNKVVDHINGIVIDNRQSNLRIVDAILNGQNRGASCNNSSGERGVYWSEKRKKWNGLVQVAGYRKNLGYFKTKEECVNAVALYREEQIKQYLRTLEE